jgi:hypothetical protein
VLDVGCAVLCSNEHQTNVRTLPGLLRQPQDSERRGWCHFRSRQPLLNPMVVHAGVSLRASKRPASVSGSEVGAGRPRLFGSRWFHAHLDRMFPPGHREADPIALGIIDRIWASEPHQTGFLTTGRATHDIGLWVPHRLRVDAVGRPRARNARRAPYDEYGSLPQVAFAG